MKLLQVFSLLRKVFSFQHCSPVTDEVCKDVPQEICEPVEHCKDIPKKDCHLDYKEVRWTWRQELDLGGLGLVLLAWLWENWTCTFPLNVSKIVESNWPMCKFLQALTRFWAFGRCFAIDHRLHMLINAKRVSGKAPASRSWVHGFESFSFKFFTGCCS